MRSTTMRIFCKFIKDIEDFLEISAECSGQEGDTAMFDQLNEDIARLRVLREDLQENYPKDTQYTQLQLVNLMQEKGMLDEMVTHFTLLAGLLTNKIRALEGDRGFLEAFNHQKFVTAGD